VGFASAEEANKHKLTYYKVFGALLVLTVLTVAVAWFHVRIELAIAIAMIVALTKGSMVAAIFMHLTSERKPLFVMLSFAVLFFLVLLLVPVVTERSTVGYYWKAQGAMETGGNIDLMPVAGDVVETAGHGGGH
jgi:cytochrome c oxidase subunit 4